MTPSPVDTQVLHRPADTVHAQQPRSSHRDRLHPPYTHSLTRSHIHIRILTQIHTISHATQTLLTHPHTPLIHSSHTAHTHALHTLTHTNTLTPHTHIHTHTPHTHTLLIPSHTHTPSHTSHLHTYTHTHTHTQAQSLQEHRHRKHGDPGAVLTHQARGACGNSPESQLSSVAGHTGGHWDS